MVCSLEEIVEAYSTIYHLDSMRNTHCGEASLKAVTLIRSILQCPSKRLGLEG